MSKTKTNYSNSVHDNVEMHGLNPVTDTSEGDSGFSNTESSIPDYYSIPPGVKDIYDLVEDRVFTVANAIKYLYRAGFKPGNSEAKDLRKALNSIRRRLDQLDTIESD